jgi:hypothetical protein
MTMPGHPAPTRGAVSLAALWFGLFGAPAAWTVEFMVNYALVAHFCYPDGTPLAAPTWGGTRTLTILTSAAMCVVALLALSTAIHSWRETRPDTDQDQKRHVAEVGEGRARFMALSGILVSGIFLFGVLMTALPTIFQPVCTY